MAKRYQGGILGAGFNPLQAPSAPTIGTATAGTASASVVFTAPANVGGSAITSYAVQSTPGGIGATGAASPITVSGLTNGTSYTFRVTALNSYGPSPASASSNSVTPAVTGQQAYTTAGTFSFVAPAGVTSVSVVAVGGGGGGSSCPNYTGGGGGGLSYGNNISVTPGCSYAVVVGAGGNGSACVGARTNGGNSSFSSTLIIGGGGVRGEAGRTGGTSTGSSRTNGFAGGTGAAGAGCSGNTGGGGGGAGGYTQIGGNGTNGTSGGGGGGGGVGLLGGTVGGGGASSTGGTGGSGGANGTNGPSGGGGGLYGGAGGGASGGSGVAGAVRIIYPGTTRSFPSTNTGDL